MTSPDLRTRGSKVADVVARAAPAVLLIGVLLVMLGLWLYFAHAQSVCESHGGHYVRDGLTGWPTCIGERPR